MNIDSTAAAYGLFQVVFADMTDHLAAALFRMRQHKEPKLEFSRVFRLEFGRMLDEFKKELSQFEERSAVSGDLHAVRKACIEMGNIARWRNDRLHARVREVDGGLALYDWRTEERLSISYEECENKIHQAIKVIVTLEAHVQPLVGLLKMRELIEQLLRPADAVI